MSHKNSDKLKKFTDKFKSNNTSQIQSESDDTSENHLDDTSNSKQSSNELELLKADNESINNKYLMLAAEFDNFRKRTARDISDSSKFAIDKFAKDLIEVLENLYRAENSINVDKPEDNVLLKQVFSGIQLTKKSLIEIFEKYGIQRINPLHEPFNHDFHQVITEIPSPEYENGLIIEVVQAGYTLHGRLIRPALVILAKN